MSHQTLISVGETTAIVETKAKGFQEHISFESTAFKERGWDLTKQYISVGETPADSRKAKGFQEHINFEGTAFKEHGWRFIKLLITFGETPKNS